MPLEHMYSGSFLDSHIYEQIRSESPVDDDEQRPEITHPGRVPDLSFLSKNFSSESLHHDVEPTFSTPEASGNKPPVTPTASSGPSAGNWPYYSKRSSFNGSNSSLVNSSTAPVGQASFSHHQRTGSSSAGSRARPRSFLATELANTPIWEYAVESPVQDSFNASFESDRAKKRNSGHFASKRTSYSPAAGFYPPSDQRVGRSRPGSPSRTTSPVRFQNTSPYRQQRASSPSKLQPFNFKPQDLSLPGLSGGGPSLVVKPAHRKGHRYKHSSVSMNLFQEPLPIADTNMQPNLIPDLYPIPNLKESFSSATNTQKFKLAVSLAHCLTSVVVFVVGVHTQQVAFSTLAHLIFYDSLGSLMASCVDVMSNFEVWSKSSIAYPFGLGRLEVLTSFALSTSLVMVGCDLISHFVEEVVVGLVDPSLADSAEHGAHHIHGSKEPGTADWVLYEVILLLVMAVTWFTSTFIFDQTPFFKITTRPDAKGVVSSDKGLLDSNANMSFKDMTMHRVKCLLRVLVNNPIRLLTLVYSAFLSVVPAIPEHLKEEFGFDLNESSTLVVASLLCYAGWNLVKTLGGILLISFPYSDYEFQVTKASIYDRILGLACFKSAYNLEKLHFTKANPRLYLACVQVRMKGGSADDESRLIFEINRIIVDTMKNFESECEVETTISAERI